MAENLNIADGFVFVDGPRSPQKARELLALAEEHGVDQNKIFTTSGGYLVPKEILAGSGKRAATESEDEKQEESEDEKQEESLFDPSEHTVEDVETYLETADEAETDRVLAAERAGKARKGIVGDDTEGAK